MCSSRIGGNIGDEEAMRGVRLARGTWRALVARGQTPHGCFRIVGGTICR